MDPEKKKTIVVGALFVAMLGIGAFQFTKGGGETPPPTDAKGGDAEAEGGKDGERTKPGDGKAEPAKNPMFAMSLGARDPFRPAAFSVAAPTPATPVKAASAPPAMPPRLGGGFVPPLPNAAGMGAATGGLTGELAPMLPPGPGGAPPLPPVAPPKPKFRGALIGVMVGARSAAVFRMDGAERVVRVGGEIEPGVRLVSLRARHAEVDFHGERLRLELRDEAPADNARPAPKTPAAPTLAAPIPAMPPMPIPAPTLPDSGSETTND